MKIEIEFNSTYKAKVTIDGREMTYGYKGGGFSYFKGMNPGEEENTIGGIVASKLSMPLMDILQGHMPDEESPDGDCWETWEELSESAASEVYDAIEP